ncbi:UDP-glucose 4-epimerase family protein [Pseudorhodoferax sp.]|uniref:UDP-glucose 4-epimerase family protein n=1 Tax=Pseudorhodoferax sp. TaxID=1993553 RepID=UPI002DD63F67|nr:SDR family oxidoreductase [Pseudorhodoferax sp.]
MTNILLTGAAGFVGRALAARLAMQPGVHLRLAVRSPSPQDLRGVGETVVVGDLAGAADLDSLLNGIDVVVHAAARAHVMREPSADPLAAYRAANVLATARLAESAARAGARRFIHLSSVKVHGDRSDAGRPWTEDSPFRPQDAYGQSKAEAEQVLQERAHRSGMDWVCVRPPLVYGPGVGANFLALMHAVRRGLPLPLGALQNRRSLIALDNLCDFISLCIRHPAAGGQTFLVSDGQDLSTPELVRALAGAMGRPARLIAIPPWLMYGTAALAGRRAAWQRLSGDLQVDIGKARALLGWQPPVTVALGLQQCVAGYSPPP